jgi:septum formation protein
VDPQLYLASASPRRKQLLEQLGLRCAVLPADVDESLRPGEDPQAYVMRLARLKAATAAERLGGPQVPVLGADTAVVLEGAVLGKPRTQAEGLAMLAQLSGRRHQVLSAVALWSSGRLESAVSESRVSFRAIPADEARAYWASGEPADKAGGYAIQGRGAVFVERLEGSYSGVMGLPLYETADLLRKAGVHIV